MTCDKRLQLAATTLFSPKNFQAEMSLLMKTYYNWGELLAPASVAISTLGQLILMSNQRLDFPIDAKPPKDGFKHIEYPKSFRSTLVQISHSGYLAFLKAHTNMGKIRGLSAGVPGHVKNAVRYLTSKSEKVISSRLPCTLTQIRESSDKSKMLAEDIANEFKKILDLIQETVLAVTATKDRTKVSFQNAKQRLETAQRKEQYSNDEAVLLKDKNSQLDTMLANLETRQRDLYLETRYGDECVASRMDETSQPGKRPLADRHPELFFNAGNWRYTFEESRLNVDHCLEESSQKLVDLLMASHQFQLKCESWQLSDSSDALDVAEELENLHRALDTLPNCPSLKTLLKNGQELKGKITTDKIRASRKTDMCPGSDETDNLAILIADARANQIKEVYEEKTIVLNNVGGMKEAHKYVRQHQKKMMEDLVETAKKMQELNGKKMQVMRHRMEEILKDLQGWNMVHLSYKEAVQVLEKGMQQLSRLKNDWDKLVELFTRIASLTDRAAQSSEAFIFFTSTSDRVSTVDDDEVFVDDLMDHAEKANAASLFVTDLASVYVNISDRFIMSRIAGLGKLLGLDVDRIGAAAIEKELASLAESGQIAFDGIVEVMKEEEAKTKEKLLDRRRQLAKDYKELLVDCLSISQLPPVQGSGVQGSGSNRTDQVDDLNESTDFATNNYDDTYDIDW